MCTRILSTLGVLVIAGLAATAVPAFTADNQSLTLTVTAQAPAAPCVAFATPPGTQVTFGTRAFSKPSTDTFGNGDVAPRFSNCGTATESLFLAGTDAQNVCTTLCVLHTWTLGGSVAPSCPTLNKFALFYGIDGFGSWNVTKATAPLRNLAAPGDPTTYTPGEAHNLSLQIQMPCEGSDGAGEAFGLSVTLTAAVA